MTFYQELQLSSAGSKQLIHKTTNPQEKRRHILVYNFKVYLVMAFCVAVVSLFSRFLGSENSVVGVTVLLAVLVLRQADFGIRTTHGLGVIALLFAILMTGPRLANMLPPLAAFPVHLTCILLLMILGCHNVIMYNHSTFVLGYLLLTGYDVQGYAFLLRVIGLFAGMLLCMGIFYKNQKHRPYRRTFSDLFREFDLHSARSRWYLKLTFIVSSAMLFMNLAGLPRAMWAGIACMSVCLPFTKTVNGVLFQGVLYNIIGCAVFLVLYLLAPGKHVSLHRNDRRNRRWLLCKLSMADRFQHLWCPLHRHHPLRSPLRPGPPYRNQHLRCCLHSPLQQTLGQLSHQNHNIRHSKILTIFCTLERV